MSEDKRAYKRFATPLCITGKMNNGISFTGHIVDLTPQGLAFLIDSNIEMDEHFELEVHLREGEKTCFQCQLVRNESVVADTLKKICAKIIYASPADNMRLYQFYKKIREK